MNAHLLDGESSGRGPSSPPRFSLSVDLRRLFMDDDCLASVAGLVAEAGRLGFRKEKESLSLALFEAL